MKKILFRKQGLMSIISIFSILFYCSCEDVSHPQVKEKEKEKEEEKKLEVYVDKAELLLEERAYAVIDITTSDYASVDTDFKFSYSVDGIVDVENINGKFYVNGNSLGTTVITVRYKGATTNCNVAVKGRDIPIDFRFVRIVDNIHALPYLKVEADRE